MAETPKGQAPPEKASPPDHRTPFERMTDLTRAIVNVPKSEVSKKKVRRSKHHDE